MKAKRSVLGTVIVGLALSVAAPAAAADRGASAAAHSDAAHSAAAHSASRPGLLSWLLDRYERPEREPPRSSRPSAVPELGAQGAAPAALVVLAGAGVFIRFLVVRGR